MAHGRLLAAASLVFVTLLTVFTVASGTRAPARHHGAKAATPSARVVQARLPLSFEPAAPGTPARYISRAADYTLFLTDTGSVLTLDRGRNRAAVLRTSFSGARSVRPRGEGRLPGVVNVLKGPKRDWRKAIPTFGRVRAESIYRGIDAVYHGRQGALEYDFEVAPGASPGVIGLDISGARRLSLAKNGDLLIHVNGGSVREARPIAYQSIDGRRSPVDVEYALSGNRVGFEVGSYDHAHPLVIDPVLTYASYLGGGAKDEPERIAVSPSDGSIFIVGSTTSNNFPGAPSRTAGRVDYDAFITHLDATGKTVDFMTILGGSGSATDKAHDVNIDLYGDPIVVGDTTATDFTSGPYAYDNCTDGGTSAWQVQISTAAHTGVPYLASCFGGSGNDSATGVTSRYVSSLTIANRRLEVYITGTAGSATNFPLVNGYTNANSGGSEAFLVTSRHICGSGAPQCNYIDYGTFLGDSGYDTSHDVAVDGSGNAYIAGDSTSDFLGGQTTPVNGSGYVAKINPNTTGNASLVYVTWLGGSAGSSASASAIAVSSSNNVYVAGRYYRTASVVSDLPGTQNGELRNYTAGNEGFVSVLNSSGTPQKAIYIGSSGASDELHDIALSEAGGVVSFTATGTFNGSANSVNGIAGQNCSSNNGYQTVVVKEVDKSHTVNSSTYNTTPVYLTCLGTSTNVYDGDGGTGVALGASDSVWVTGHDITFPTTADAKQAASGGGENEGFLALISRAAPDILSGPNGAVGSHDVAFTFHVDSDMTPQCSDASGGQLLTTRSSGSCTGADKTSYTGLAEGPHTFQISGKDAGGTEGPVASRDFVVDTTPPGAFDLTSPDEGATTSTTPEFKWVVPSDATALSYQILIDGQKLQDVPGSACDGGTCTATSASSLLGGPHKWKVAAVDAAGNTTTSSSERNFTVADPPTAKLVVAPNPARVNTVVIFDGSGSADDRHTIAKYEWDFDGDGTFDSDTGATAQTSHSYPNAGVFNATVRVTDTGGLVGTATMPVTITSASGGSVPIGVSINAGAQYTNKPDVELTVVPPTGTTALLISNDGGFATAVPQIVKKTIAWKLDSSGPERLPKTVYVRFLTGPFASPNYTDDIILDERPPIVDSASVVGGTSTAAAQAAKLQKFKVKVKAHDTNSGVAGVQIAVSKKKPGKLLKYKKSVTTKLASRPKFIRAKDRAGNFSKWRKLR